MGRRNKQGTGQGSLNVLDLARCGVKTKAWSHTALGTFLQCKGLSFPGHLPEVGYNLWQRISARGRHTHTRARRHTKTHKHLYERSIPSQRPTEFNNRITGVKPRAMYLVDLVLRKACLLRQPVMILLDVVMQQTSLDTAGACNVIGQSCLTKRP